MRYAHSKAGWDGHWLMAEPLVPEEVHILLPLTGPCTLRQRACVPETQQKAVASSGARRGERARYSSRRLVS